MCTHSQEITLKALSSAKPATPLTTSKAESSEDEGEEESEEEESEGVEDEGRSQRRAKKKKKMVSRGTVFISTKYKVHYRVLRYLIVFNNHIVDFTV